MPKETLRDYLIYLFGEAGFIPTTRCYLNYRFALAILAGLIVVWVMHVWVQPYPSHVEFNQAQLLTLIVWQPLLEEVLFRGIIQGQLIKQDWAKRELGKNSWLSISGANAVTSVLFVAMHMINSLPLFALTVFVPSLVFGYFRDRCNSVYPCIIIHSSYNAMVFVGLILNGNLKLPLF